MSQELLRIMPEREREMPEREREREIDSRKVSVLL